MSEKNNKHDQSTFYSSAPVTSAGSCIAESGYIDLQEGEFPTNPQWRKYMTERRGLT